MNARGESLKNGLKMECSCERHDEIKCGTI